MLWLPEPGSIRTLAGSPAGWWGTGTHSYLRARGSSSRPLSTSSARPCGRLYVSPGFVRVGSPDLDRRRCSRRCTAVLFAGSERTGAHKHQPYSSSSLVSVTLRGEVVVRQAVQRVHPPRPSGRAARQHHAQIDTRLQGSAIPLYRLLLWLARAFPPRCWISMRRFVRSHLFRPSRQPAAIRSEVPAAARPNCTGETFFARTLRPPFGNAPAFPPGTRFSLERNLCLLDGWIRVGCDFKETCVIALLPSQLIRFSCQEIAGGAARGALIPA